MLAHYGIEALVGIYKLTIATIVTFTPLKIIEYIVKAKFAKGNINILSLEDVKKDSSIEPKPYDIVVNDKRFFRHFAKCATVGFGEGYMNGWFDCKDICGMATQFLRNNKVPITDLTVSKLRNTVNHQTTGFLSARVIDDHYDLGNDLYTNMLQSNMVYTCAYWKDAKNLEEAQINKLDLIARKLQLEPGMTVLDLGCGFGSLCKYFAEKYKVSCVGYTLAKEQVKYANSVLKDLPVEIRCEDYRNAAKTGEKFDRVVSVGFFEAIGVHNFRTYFEVVEKCMKDDGLSLLHTITARDQGIPKAGEFGEKYIFPGGMVPHPEDFQMYSEGLLVIEDIQNFGAYYTPTLQAWHTNFKTNWSKLEDSYGQRLNGRFYRMWEWYLLWSAALFNSRVLMLYQVVQSKKGIAGGYESVR